MPRSRFKYGIHVAVARLVAMFCARGVETERVAEKFGLDVAIVEAVVASRPIRCRARKPQCRGQQRTPREKYNAQRNSARARGIDWQLTFDEWWAIWTESGHWNERGLGRYLMARHGDTGPYGVSNVVIITHAQNILDSNRPENVANRRAFCVERRGRAEARYAQEMAWINA